VAKVSVILPAAGRSSRFADPREKKPFVLLHEKPVWIHSVEKFSARQDVIQMIVVVAPDDLDMFRSRFEDELVSVGIEVAAGGAQRSDSVEAALARVCPEADLVAIHDAARPCVAPGAIDEVFRQAEATGAAMLAVPVTGTIKRVGSDRRIVETVDRTELWEAQTPQVFRRKTIEQAYAARGDLSATDDAQLVERIGQPVSIVEGSRTNLKITTREDLQLAEAILNNP